MSDSESGDDALLSRRIISKQPRVAAAATFTRRGQSSSKIAVGMNAQTRLYDLFALIEKEFENLYEENLALRARLAALNSSGRQSGGAGVGDEATVQSETVEVAFGAHGSDTLPPKATKQKAREVGQRLKTALKVPPGRFVNSIKAGVSGVGDQIRVRAAGRPFTGHRDGVWHLDTLCLPAQNNRTVLGSASADQTAKIWCVESSCCVAQYLGHSGSVNSISFCSASIRPGTAAAGDPRNGLLAVTASGDRTAHIWRAVVTLPTIRKEDDDEDDKMEDSEDVFEPVTIRLPIRELTGHLAPVACADWLQSGRQVVTASWDRQGHVYDIETGEILHVLTGHDQELTHCCAHGTQKMVVTSSKDTTFRLWDFREHIHSVAVFQGHTESVSSAVFTTAGDKIISGSDDRSVKKLDYRVLIFFWVWDLRNMRSSLTTIRLDSPVNRIAVSAKHHIIAIPHDNRNIRLYDLNGIRVARLPRSNRHGHSRMVCSAVWADDNPKMNLFSAGFDKFIFGWKYSGPVQTERQLN